MDPRLQSNHGPMPLQDVRPAPPAPAPVPSPPPTPAATQPAPNPIAVAPATNYEVVDSIPMAQPSTLATGAPANQQSPQPAETANKEPEDELDKILQAVNNRVQAPIKPEKSKGKLAAKVAGAAGKVKPPKASGNKPVLPMAAVVVIVVGLCAAAVMAYRQGGHGGTLSNQPGKVGTSSDSAAAIQSAGGTLVRPADLDDYSQTLSQQLNGLNDSGDFDANSLSQSVVGL